MKKPALKVLTLFCLLSGVVPAGMAKPMNVLLIVADDLNTQLGCYGNATVKSPNIDRLASMGVRFDRAYCNYPLCNPSRTSFLSGRYPETTQVFGNNTAPRTSLGNIEFMPEYFRTNGYFTARVGKVAHGKFEDALKWDVSEDSGKDDDETEEGKPRTRKRNQEGAQDVPFAWRASDLKDEQEPDGRTSRRISELLEQHKGNDKPFFLAAGFHKPHIPHVAPKKYFDLYSLDKIPLPKEPAGHSKDIPAIAHSPKYYPDLTDTQKRSIILHYYAATTFMDSQVGILLDTMDRLKMWDNTIVIFLGDHGWHHGEHDGMWAKMSLMEESARAPLIVVAPGKKHGAVCSRVVEFVDLYPTLTDFCGLKTPGGLEGLSFASLLKNPAQPWKKGVFSVVNRRGGLGHSVRSEEFTYTEWPDGSTQLYNHVNDPKEYLNLAKKTDYVKTLAEMKALLHGGPKAARPNVK
ncbi:MAG: Choline-sulfatase [Verrucomicrobiales bacterium]|nr:Choline-sulfatase [Verrucomicrobiales bacterium]